MNKLCRRLVKYVRRVERWANEVATFGLKNGLYVVPQSFDAAPDLRPHAGFGARGGRGGLVELLGQAGALGFESHRVGLVGVGRAGHGGVSAVVQGLDFRVQLGQRLVQGRFGQARVAREIGDSYRRHRRSVQATGKQGNLVNLSEKNTHGFPSADVAWLLRFWA